MNFVFFIYKKLQAISFSNCRNKSLQYLKNGRNVFDESVKNDLRTRDNIQNISIQGDD